jgi:hypothetical protein
MSVVAYREDLSPTLQDHCEMFWRTIAPGLPDNLITRVAFAFKAQRQVAASRRNLELSRTCNAACHWDGHSAGFVLTHFGRVVFAPPIDTSPISSAPL